MIDAEGDRPPQRIRTMEDFSAASGISRPTLSRFFNDPQSVRPASRARIERAVERFGYRPNLLATNFNRRNPKTIGIVVPSLLDPFYAGLIQRIEKLARHDGYWTVVQNAQGEPDREAEAIATLMSMKVAGAIVIPLGHASRTTLFRDMAAEMPLIFLDARADAEGAFVGTNNDQSMNLIVDYLLRTGGPPSYFDMPDVNQNARERRRAYEKAMEDRDAEPKVLRVRDHNWDFERIAFDEAANFFRSGVALGDTILCANDRIAFGVMAAASQAGVMIDRKTGLRIAGHDDHPLSQYTCPSLTTVAQDGERLANISLDLLMSAIAKGRNTDAGHRLDAKLIMRASA